MIDCLCGYRRAGYYRWLATVKIVGVVFGPWERLLRINRAFLASRKEFEVGARRVPGVELGLSRWAV